MRKRKLLALTLAVAMTATVFTGCSLKPSSDSGQTAPAAASDDAKETAAASGSQDAKDASADQASGDLKPLRVAVQPYYNGMQMAYILDQKLDEQNGIKIEPILFSNGATQNEALSADLWDVSMTGGAFVFGVANYDAKVVGSHIDGTGGNELYVRPDSPIAQVKGYNPTYPDVLGSPETVKGAKIIMATGTTSQLCAVKWLEAVGVQEEDVELVNMEYAAGYQAFLAGQADAVVLVSPYCYDAPEQGWVKAADLINLDTPNYEEIVASKSAYESKKDEIQTFLKLVYMANDALEADPDKKVEYTMKWYADNANEVTEESAKAECDLKPLITSEKAREIEMGIYEKNYAEFMVMIDKLDSSQVQTVVDNVKPELMKAALESMK
ncbi:ABC transporter substrate-binding protein [Diplocloster hominis]|uniref:ABC transporter substrate-binding protein n=1 Tax=Diplocloster hominis TaxID=3079010 RepID=UPI0031B9AF4B